MYEGLKIANMYTLSETIAAELLLSVTYPWEALPKIGDFIKKLGPTLPEEDYEYRGEYVWVAKDAWTSDHRQGCRSQTLCIYPW